MKTCQFSPNYNSCTSEAFLQKKSRLFRFPGVKERDSFTPGNLWTDHNLTSTKDLHWCYMSFTQNINCFPWENVTESQSANSSLQVLLYSTLDQRNKPPQVSVLPGECTARLTACHRSFMLCRTVYTCTCIKSQKSVKPELCMCVCMYVYACAHVWVHAMHSLLCACVCVRTCMCAYVVINLFLVVICFCFKFFIWLMLKYMFNLNFIMLHWWYVSKQISF